MARSLLYEIPGFLWVFVPVCTLFSWTSASWLQCSLYFFYSRWFYNHVTMDKRRVTLSPHDIQPGKKQLFSFFWCCVYIYFFSILEDSVRKKSFVLFNHCIIWNTSPLSLAASVSPLTSTSTVSCHSRGGTETLVFIMEEPPVLLFLFYLFIFICN